MRFRVTVEQPDARVEPSEANSHVPRRQGGRDRSERREKWGGRGEGGRTLHWGRWLYLWPASRSCDTIGIGSGGERRHIGHSGLFCSRAVPSCRWEWANLVRPGGNPARADASDVDRSRNWPRAIRSSRWTAWGDGGNSVGPARPCPPRTRFLSLACGRRVDERLRHLRVLHSDLVHPFEARLFAIGFRPDEGERELMVQTKVLTEQIFVERLPLRLHVSQRQTFDRSGFRSIVIERTVEDPTGIPRRTDLLLAGGSNQRRIGTRVQR